MAQHKSFQTYAPTDGSSFDINGINFRLRPSIPGDVLLDFLAGFDEKDSSKVAATMRGLMKEALLPEEWDKWNAFIREPANNVTMDVLAEIAGFVAEKMSGNPTDSSQDPFTGGLSTVGTR